MPLNTRTGAPVTPTSQLQEMNAPTLISAVLLLTLMSATANPREMERRLQEQERQIARLETENSQLRWLINRRGIELDDPSLIRSTESGTRSVTDLAVQSHTVKKGESLSQIARTAGTTAEILASLNEIKDPKLIQIGQQLRLPEAKSPETLRRRASTRATDTHVVAAGETLYRISIIHGMKLDQLVNENPGVDPQALQIGQKLRVVPRTEQATGKTSVQDPSVS